jgi:hypothetical protein
MASASRPSDEDNPEDFVKVLVEYLDGESENTERLWAKPLGAGRYEIRSTPWFVYGINWGDVVLCAELATDEVPRVLEVIDESGHKTVRVIFNAERTTPDAQQRILATLNDMHAFYERYNDRLVAVDVEPEADYAAVFEFLARCHSDDLLIFEEAWQSNEDGTFGPDYQDTQPDPGW